jgi:hypothetical protein
VNDTICRLTHMQHTHTNTHTHHSAETAVQTSTVSTKTEAQTCGGLESSWSGVCSCVLLPRSHSVSLYVCLAVTYDRLCVVATASVDSSMPSYSISDLKQTSCVPSCRVSCPIPSLAVGHLGPKFEVKASVSALFLPLLQALPQLSCTHTRCIHT